MNTRHLIALISRIRENANKFLLNELKQRGVEGLAPSHGDILTTLYHHETVTMAELAERIHRDKSTVTVLVEKLVKSGYVKKIKSPADRRITNICLTEAGKALEPVFEEISEKLIHTAYQGFSAFEQEILIRLLERIQQNWRNPY
jgi:DNA-binding MarR family transcriptional regulator